MTIRTFCIKTHRFLGAILSLLFVLWFLSAFVIIYCHYPKYRGSERAKHSPLLEQRVILRDSSLLKLENTFKQSYPKSKLTEVVLKNDLRMGEHYEVESQNGKTHYYDLELKEIQKDKTINQTYFSKVAGLWHKKVLSVDTLNSLDQWTPFSRLRKDLPFYRLRLSGEGNQEVYISSRDGRIITEHTRAERIGAYFGAIPHWVYFTFIRQNTDLWVWTIIILSGFGVFMVLTGIYVGIDMMRLARRKKKKPELSPYRKKSYRWHHILGTFFGIFILSWIFSGLMSVVDIPDWLAGERDLRGYNMEKEMPFETQNYPKQAQEKLFKTYGEGIRSLAWTSHFGIPTVEVTDKAGNEHIYRYDKGTYKPFQLKQEEVEALVQEAYGKEQAYTVSKITAYDGYYSFKPKGTDDFVWKVEIETAGSPTAYFNNASASLRMVDHKSRLNQWLYQKPHTLKFKWLKQYPWLWTVVIWTLLLIGLFVSITGLIMSVPYFRRAFKTKKKK